MYSGNLVPFPRAGSDEALSSSQKSVYYADVDEKYNTPIRLAEEKGKYIALLIIFALVMISVGITLMIM